MASVPRQHTVAIYSYYYRFESRSNVCLALPQQCFAGVSRHMNGDSFNFEICIAVG